MASLDAPCLGTHMTNLQATGREPLVGRSFGAMPALLSWSVATTAMIGLMLAPAIWNGFPIIFPDTGGYFTAPIVGELANGRSALYGLFLYLAIPLAFWPSIIAQAALMAWLIAVTLRVNGLAGRPYLALGIVALLCAVTSLPWFAGQLMPDILFAAAALSLYLLAYGDAQLVRWERFVLGAVIAFAMASHMAAAGVCVAVVMALAVTHIRRLNLPKARLTFAAASIAAGILLQPVSNAMLTGSFAFTPGGSNFLFGRLVEDGIVQRYLEDNCPDTSIRLCDYKGKMPDNADAWLWWGGSPLYKMGGWAAYEPEAKRIIRATLAEYPLTHAATAIEAAIMQFLSFKTEVRVVDNEHTHWSVRDFAPQLYPALLAARQHAAPFDVGPLNWLHLPVAYLSLAAMALAMIFRRRLNLSGEAYALCLVLFAALAANAVICGVFSHPVDRYQSRLVLLAPFVVAIVVAQRFVHRPRPG
jgi:hypothetical protein